MNTIGFAVRATFTAEVLAGSHERRYAPPGFSADLECKDLGLAIATAADAGTVLPSATVLESVFAEAIDGGMGDLDRAVIAEVTRRRSGLAAPEHPFSHDIRHTSERQVSEG